MKEFQQNASSLSSINQIAATGFQAYMNALIEAGAIEGRLGEQKLIAELEPAMEIIHQVLAGAELKVSIEVVREPDTDMLHHFEEKRQEAQDKANKLNKELGMLYAMA